MVVIKTKLNFPGVLGQLICRNNFLTFNILRQNKVLGSASPSPIYLQAASFIDARSSRKFLQEEAYLPYRACFDLR
jgi:hypothetical protein